MTFALARIADCDGNVADGAGLALFQLDVRNADRTLNGIVIHKLKRKLGTRGLPTAELELVGARARLVSANGVGRISTLFNITRIHNGCGAASAMRRVVAIVRDYTPRRWAFGATLAANALHLRTVATLEAHARAAMLATLDCAQLLGESELGGGEAKRVLRVATPVLKLFTAKQAVLVASEGVEALGAHGYMEDAPVAQALRDAQVLPIWEGTTNVLALDVLRAHARDAGALAAFLARCVALASESAHAALRAAQAGNRSRTAATQ